MATYCLGVVRILFRTGCISAPSTFAARPVAITLSTWVSAFKGEASSEIDLPGEVSGPDFRRQSIAQWYL